MALHRKHEAAADILERQDVDADHRPVEGRDIEEENSRKRVEGPGAAVAARDRGNAPGSGHGHISLAESDRHCVISRRISTTRRIRAIMAMRTRVSSTALAAATRYCSTPTFSSKRGRA